MGLDAQDKLTMEGIERRMGYHKPTDSEQLSRYDIIVTAALAFLKVIMNLCPAGPQRHAAFHEVESAVFRAKNSLGELGEFDDILPGLSAGSAEIGSGKALGPEAQQQKP